MKPNQLPSMRLAILLPSGSFVHADFMMSMTTLIQFLCRQQIPGYGGTSLAIFNKRSSLLPASREMLVDDAIKSQCSHALFIDSDQSFPQYAVHQLVQHQKPVIGANVALKKLPSEPSARNSITERKPVYSNGKEGIEEVQYLGFGLTMIDLAFIQTVPKPWFPIEYRAGLGYVGEDLSFCEKVRASGGSIWIDHDLSQQVLHMGDYPYGHDDVPNLPE